MVHYRVEVAPGSAASVGKEPIASMEKLEGNGQLWLCLQDMAQPNFLSKFNRKDTVVETPTEIIKTVYETEMVIVTDDDWDLKGDKLLTAQGKGFKIVSEFYDFCFVLGLKSIIAVKRAIIVNRLNVFVTKSGQDVLKSG